MIPILYAHHPGLYAHPPGLSAVLHYLEIEESVRAAVRAWQTIPACLVLESAEARKAVREMEAIGLVAVA